jgi:hypothetical protein
MAQSPLIKTMSTTIAQREHAAMTTRHCQPFTFHHSAPLSCHPEPFFCHSEPFALCHSEEAKRPKNLTQGKLREESHVGTDLQVCPLRTGLKTCPYISLLCHSESFTPCHCERSVAISIPSPLAGRRVGRHPARIYSRWDMGNGRGLR